MSHIFSIHLRSERGEVKKAEAGLRVHPTHWVSVPALASPARVILAMPFSFPILASSVSLESPCPYFKKTALSMT